VEAAFFDLDKTVIAKASMVAFGRPLYREGLVSRRTILRALYAQLIYMQLGASEQKLARIRDAVLTLTRGWERSRVREIVRDTMEEVVQPIIHAEALELIEEHHAAGRRVFLVSASPEEIVEPMAAYLGVDGAIASRARIDAEGRYTGEMEFYAYGPYKAEAMRELAAAQGIDLASSYAYSDSYTDVPMLETVGHPVVVNPDRVLSRLARDRGWEARQFVRPVPLREGEPVRRKGPLAALVGSVAAGMVTAGLVWWRVQARRPPPPANPAPASWLSRLSGLRGRWRIPLGDPD
jgi:HAD superfamily hydrolase (TIGR01490 family)